MSIKELAEREYPFANMHTQMNLIKSRERAAFIKGLEIGVLFSKYLHNHPTAHQEWYFDQLEIFLTEKYGSNEQQ